MIMVVLVEIIEYKRVVFACGAVGWPMLISRYWLLLGNDIEKFEILVSPAGIDPAGVLRT